MLSRQEMEVTSASIHGDDGGSQAGKEPTMALKLLRVGCRKETSAGLIKPKISVKMTEQQILNHFVSWLTLEFFENHFLVKIS